jgi:hypothetical protein
MATLNERIWGEKPSLNDSPKCEEDATMEEKGKVCSWCAALSPKAIVTSVLLLFVFCSVAFLIIQEVHPGRAKEGAATKGAIDPTTPAFAMEKAPSAQPSHKVIAYYFHGTARCINCIKIETFTEQAMGHYFTSAIKGGRLEWRVVNVETSGNEHFIKDYALFTKSVVLVDVDTQSGRQLRWKNLDKVWNYLNDKEGFINYIRVETRSYLGEDG